MMVYVDFELKDDWSKLNVKKKRGMNMTMFIIIIIILLSFDMLQG